MPTLLYKLCCVGLAVKLLNNYRPRKSARTFANKQKASNKVYTVLPVVFIHNIVPLLNVFQDLYYILLFS